MPWQATVRVELKLFSQLDAVNNRPVNNAGIFYVFPINDHKAQFCNSNDESVVHAGYGNTSLTDGTSLTENNKSHAREEHGVKWPVSREEDSLSQKFKVDSRPGRRAGLDDAVPGRRAGLDDAVPGRRAGLDDAVPGTRPIPHRVDKLKDNNTRDVYHIFTRPTSDNILKPYTPSSIGASLKPADDLHSSRPTSDKSLKPYTPSSIGANLKPAGDLHSVKSTKQRPIPEWLKSPSTISVQGNPAKVFTVKGKSKHNVFIPSDSYKCIIKAICVLPDGKVLVADSGNQKVKLLNQQYQVVSHCGVTAGPWDMCVITPSEVAVSVYHGIQFITVNKTQLVPGRKVQLEHDCKGIAHHQMDLFITSRKALYKYSLSGNLVCILYEDVSGPYTGQVLVCAELSSNVLQVGWEGQSKLTTLATWEDGLLLGRVNVAEDVGDKHDAEATAKHRRQRSSERLSQIKVQQCEGDTAFPCPGIAT
ncbi:uncharacterized protein LOC127840472 [Dreissena polymorpha]|uniref:uncharacterized protein LOC127840472 n=1 Tax=Dreissena polymorpha TaxID=45954 RepID=UPI0022653140|nr:uncharacterized protein LOC127840472 [Dreissena polymorpha]